MPRKSGAYVSPLTIERMLAGLKSFDPDENERGREMLSRIYGSLLRERIRDELEIQNVSSFYTDDLLEIALLKALRKINGFRLCSDLPNGFYDWLWQFALNEIRNLRRKLHPIGERPNPGGEPLVSLDLLLEKSGLDGVVSADSIFPTGNGSPEEYVMAEEICTYVRLLHDRALKELSELHASIVERHHLAETPELLRSIAQDLGYADSTVRNASRPALAKYQEAFCHLLRCDIDDGSDSAELARQVEQMIGSSSCC